MFRVQLANVPPAVIVFADEDEDFTSDNVKFFVGLAGEVIEDFAGWAGGSSRRRGRRWRRSAGGGGGGVAGVGGCGCGLWDRSGGRVRLCCGSWTGCGGLRDGTGCGCLRDGTGVADGEGFLRKRLRLRRRAGCTVSWSAGSEELALRDGARGNGAGFRGRARLRVGRFTGTSVDCARFVEIVARDGGVFHRLDGDEFPRLLVVFNRRSNTNLSTRELV